MNKTDLIEKANSAVKNPMSAADSVRFMNATFNAISEALAAGDTVHLIGFGTFGVKDRAPRTGHNPQTGETIEIPGCRAPYFKASKVLKEFVNNG